MAVPISEYAVRNRDKITQVAIVCILWIILCLTGALIILKQMAAVNEIVRGEDEEDLDAAWFSFWVMTCVVVPILAGGGNIIRWVIYQNWVLNSGSVVSQATKVPPKSVQPEELYNDQEGGFSCFS